MRLREFEPLDMYEESGIFINRAHVIITLNVRILRKRVPNELMKVAAVLKYPGTPLPV